MPKISDSSVSEVKRAASIVEVVGRVVQLRKDGADWKGLCPFHEEKTPSFHVREHKGFFKCFGCGKGGDAIRFVMDTESLTFTRAVETLAERFHVSLEFDGPPPAAAAPIATDAHGEKILTAALDPKLKRAMRYLEKRRQEQEAEKRMDAARERLLRPAVARRELTAWPEIVRKRFFEGNTHLGPGALAVLADARGWPIEWAQWLSRELKAALPVLPWCDRGEDEQRGPAFMVEAPVMATDGERRICRDLLPVGYHQRFAVNGGKGWIYAPYLADSAKIRTNFQEEMRRLRATAGTVEADAGVPALPFVAGSVCGACFLLIAEGQWDAVTFAGACGWLDDDENAWPVGAVIMGARGASGVDTLLAYWSEWLFWEAPAVLVLSDNDAAGLKWDTPADPGPGRAQDPTFAEKLKFAGARRVEVSRVRPVYGKDFNDYWRARHPSRATMAAWLRELRFTNAAGEWI